jgi:D-sedoheptulose 7-phosphate isomerase
VKSSPGNEWFSDAVRDRVRLVQMVLKECRPQIDEAAKLILGALETGHKVLACGNGGSAADAQHFAAELVGRYHTDRVPLPALSLAADPSVLTALANDFGYEEVFARQVRALGGPGDVLLVLTTSGASPNILRAAKTARELGLICVALTSDRQTTLSKWTDSHIRIPSDQTALIQEMHTFVLHYWCECIDRLWRPKPRV